MSNRFTQATQWKRAVVARFLSKRRSGILAFAALVLIIGNSLLLYRSISNIDDSADMVRFRLEARQVLSDVLSTLLDAETGQRGFLVTSDPHYLGPYYRAKQKIDIELTQLKAKSTVSGTISSRVAEIERLAAKKLDELAATIEAHQRSGPHASNKLVSDGHGRQIMDRIRELLSEAAGEEKALLNQTTAQYQWDLRLSHLALVVFAIMGIVLVGGLYVLMRLEIRHRAQAAAQMQDYGNRMKQAADDVKRERNQVAKLNDASQFLQACSSTEEIGAIASTIIAPFFNGFDGALYVFGASRNQLTRISSWGSELPRTIAANQCWGLRRGQAHEHDAVDSLPACEHFGGLDAPATLCVPLSANGAVLGLLVLKTQSLLPHDDENANLQKARTIATLVARQLGLSLSNLRLQDTLKDQSIRDPLTALFNRRYLEIVAEKELALAHRHGRSMAVIMLDVDHFKKFNDVYGHAAGDAALVSVAGYISRNLREGDWAFRYGGEEFIILMRETSVEAALAKAESLCSGIAAVPLALGSTQLPNVTASLGVAIYPSNGGTLEDLLQSADEALYASKHAGRNTVTCAIKVAA
jgi:diguanylate cyclase (GGDEF)-like protein